MSDRPGPGNCPSCDIPVATGLDFCPSCGFRLVARTDAQVLLGLLRGETPRPVPPTPPVPAPAVHAPAAPPRQPASDDPTELLDVTALPGSVPPGPSSATSVVAGAPAEPSLFLPAGPAASAPERTGPEPAGSGAAGSLGGFAGRSPGLLHRLPDRPLDRLRRVLPAVLSGRWTGADRAGRMAVLGALGLVLLVVVGLVAALSGLVGGLRGSGRAGRSAAPSAPVLVLSPVDPAGITARASSTLHPGTRGYQARNTLDGRDDTAWNGDGNKDGRGVGMTLTWTFDRPQHVRRITARNGYVRSGKDADVYHHNGRLARVAVLTDHGRTEWQLADTPAPQSLTFDLGSTTRVTFQVLAVYPGTRYKDLALTDIGFDAA